MIEKEIIWSLNGKEAKKRVENYEAFAGYLRGILEIITKRGIKLDYFKVKEVKE